MCLKLPLYPHPTPFPLNEKHLLIQINDINIDEGAEARSNYRFILLGDDDVVED